MSTDDQIRRSRLAADAEPAPRTSDAPGRATLTSRLAPSAASVAAQVLRVLRKERDGNGVAADAEDAVGRAAVSNGEALPDDVRGRFEGSLGADLSGVRVHRSADSAAAADAVGARAYTVGQDIHFGAGQYAPQDPFGMHLLAHEVAHTVQQSSGAARAPQFKLDVSTPGDALEVEADRAADAMVAGHAAPIGSSSGGAILRQPAPAARPARPFTSPAVKQVTDAEAPPTPAQEDGLHWLEGGDQGPWKNVFWPEVQAGAARRIFHPELIDQRELGVCGAAAVLSGTADNEPIRYAMDVREVFRNGRYGTHKQVNSDLLKATVLSGMDQSDWMMFSAMQDTQNLAWDFKGRPEHDGARADGITSWLEDIAGAKRVQTYTWDLEGIDKINGLLARYSKDIIVIASVRAADLPGQPKESAIIENSDHIIRILAPITGLPSRPVVTAFSWGANRTFEFDDWKAYKKCVYSFKVGTHSDQVPL